MAPFSLPLVVIWGGSGLGRGRVLWLVEDDPLGQGWGLGNRDILASREPHVRQPQARACSWLCPAHPRDAPLPSSPPLLRTLPEAQVGLGLSRRVLHWGVEGELGWGLGGYSLGR